MYTRKNVFLKKETRDENREENDVWACARGGVFRPVVFGSVPARGGKTFFRRHVRRDAPLEPEHYGRVRAHTHTRIYAHTHTHMYAYKRVHQPRPEAKRAPETRGIRRTPSVATATTSARLIIYIYTYYL